MSRYDMPYFEAICCAPRWLIPTPCPKRRAVSVNPAEVSVTSYVSLSEELMPSPSAPSNKSYVAKSKDTLRAPEEPARAVTVNRAFV